MGHLFVIFFIVQVEFSNVVVVNKGDLVNEDQKADIIAKISLLNPKAKVVESIQSKVKMSEILNTHLFKAATSLNNYDGLKISIRAQCKGLDVSYEVFLTLSF